MGQNPGALLVTPNWLVVMDVHPPQHIKIMNFGLTCLTNVNNDESLSGLVFTVILLTLQYPSMAVIFPFTSDFLGFKLPFLECLKASRV